MILNCLRIVIDFLNFTGPKKVENSAGSGAEAATVDPKSSEAKGRRESRLDGPYWTNNKILDLTHSDHTRRMSPRVKTPKRCTMCNECGGEKISEVQKKLNFTQE